MAIELTEAAAEHVNKMLALRNKKLANQGLGLRIATKKNGCTGFSYVVDYADEISDDDVVFDTQGIKIIVSNRHLEQLDGMTLDFKKNNILNEGFDFINPNVKEMCGCGESFSV